jgi:dTDP-4-dehydrorhamnose reductase
MRRVLRDVHPNVILFPAAEPDVEWCEREPDAARVANLVPLQAALTAAEGIPVVAFSSDYVFDGANGPYAEDAHPRPLSAYGRIKVELEELVRAAGGCVVRTTTVFGPEADPPKNFVLRMIGSIGRRETVRVPEDQISTPTYAPDLATAVVRIASLGKEARGIWHVAGPDLLARHELAYLVADVFGLDRARIEPLSTTMLRQLAPRPRNGGLMNGRYERRWGPPCRPVRAALEDLRMRLGSLPDRT